MPIKNTVLKALANAIRQAKRRNDPAAVDELETKRRARKQYLKKADIAITSRNSVIEKKNRLRGFCSILSNM